MAKLIDKYHLDEIIPFLVSGDVVGFPTETVYGLGIIYNNYDSFLKLANVKQREITKPITAMVSDLNKIQEIAKINKKQEKIIRHFMPGSITVILKAQDNLPAHVTMNRDTIGVRIPSNDIALEILKKINLPLLVTSANLASLPSCVKYQEVVDLFFDKISAIVTEDSQNDLASTIVDLTQDEPVLLRQGPISFENILKVWRDE